MISYWKPGDHVLERGIFNRQVWIARPMTVVHDSPEISILSLVPGARCKLSAGLIQRKYSNPGVMPPSRWDEYEENEWQLQDWVWRQRRFLIFKEPGDYFSICLAWDDASGKFLCWYVNFELPFSRSPIGFDTLDLELDLVVNTDRTWHWKDETEYQAGVRRGLITANMVKQVELAREEALQRITRQISPFDDTWLNWRPDSSWGIPTLPAGWQHV